MPQEDADHGVRQLVLARGSAQARTLVPPERKALVDIAAEVLSYRRAYEVTFAVHG